MKTKLLLIMLVGLFYSNLQAQVIDIKASYSPTNATINTNIVNMANGLVLVMNSDEINNGSRIYVTCTDRSGKVVYDNWWSLDATNMANKNWIRLPYKSYTWNYKYPIGERLQAREIRLSDVKSIRLKFEIRYIADSRIPGIEDRGWVEREFTFNF